MVSQYGTILALKGILRITQPKGMTSTRILLINDDRLLLRLYHEKLEENGFVVDTARELGQARKLLAERKPDVVLMDLVFLQGNALELVSSIRADSSTAQIPILILPSILTQQGNQWVRAGVTKTIRVGSSPLASIIDGIKASLGMPGLGDAADTALFKPEDFWVQAIIANAAESINQMRHCLPGMTETPPELPALHDLWNLSHAFAQKAALLPNKPFVQFAAALDLLLQDLNETPEQLNPSTLRTVGQAIDFLATIARPACMERLSDPSNARLMVVDDEETARHFIVAALELANLKAESAGSPSRAIEKLNGKGTNLIFLDVGLPEMNGFELCAKIRAIEAHKTTPIVFITGMATFQNKAKASLSGGNDFIGKPFNLPELGVKALIWLFRGQLGSL